MFTFLIDLPTEIKGFSMVDDEGNHIVILNARLNHEANLQSYLHELKHRDDFNNIEASADSIEAIRHSHNIKLDKGALL